MNWSKDQENVFEQVTKTDNSINISACPGSGKTTTLIEVAKRIPSEKSKIFLAFNKSIVTELSQRLPQDVECSTLHAKGMKILYAHLKKLKVTKYKTFNLASGLANIKAIKSQKEQLKKKFILSDIIDMSRVNVSNDMRSIADNYGIAVGQDDINLANDLLHIINKYNRSSRRVIDIDFIDMLYMPIDMSMRFPKYDFVMIDEAQDLSPVQHRFIENLLKRNSRIVSVGDPYQAIYGFAGADAKSFFYFSQRKNTQTLKLRTSYRCPIDVVNLAHQINPDIEPFKNNEKGVIEQGGIEKLEEAQPNDLILCRNNKPLFVAYFELLKYDKPAYILGSDIEKGILNLCNDLKVQLLSSQSIGECLAAEKDKIADQLIERGIDNFMRHPAYTSFEEKSQIVKYFYDKFCNIDIVIQKFKQVFTVRVNAVRLMTIHKSKGLEAENVFLIRKFDDKQLMPSEFAETDEQKDQERNLEYVAITRAQKRLVNVEI